MNARRQGQYRIINRQRKEFLVSHDEFMAIVHSGRNMTGIVVQNEATGIWEPLIEVAERFGGVLAVPQSAGKLPPLQKPRRSWFEPKRPRPKPQRDLSMHAYIDGPLDELLYKDRPGLMCRSCNGVLVWTHRLQLFGRGFGFAILMLLLAAFSLFFAAEHGLVRAGQASAKVRQCLAEATDRMDDALLPQELRERVLSGSQLFRSDYAVLGRDEASVVLNASQIIAAGKEHVSEQNFQRFIGTGLLLIGIAAIYLAWQGIERQHVMRCDRCGLTVRR